MVDRFEIKSGRIHITDSNIEEDTHGVNLWNLRALNGTWEVESSEEDGSLWCSHPMAKSPTAEECEIITINSGMISIMDAEVFTKDDVDTLQNMIEDGFGNSILLENGIIMGTKHEQGTYEVTLVFKDEDIVSIRVDLDPDYWI